MRTGQFLAYGRGKEIIALDQEDLIRERISIIHTSTFKIQNKIEFFGMPQHYHENELDELLDFNICEKCNLPKVNNEITCKRCIREIHKTRGALPTHVNWLHERQVHL